MKLSHFGKFLFILDVSFDANFVFIYLHVMSGKFQFCGIINNM